MAYEFVDPPRGLSYAAPMVDFGIIGDLGNTYRQAQQQQRQADVADAFKNQPLPLDPATGLPDYGKIMQVLASKGGIDAITRLAPSANEQMLLRQAQDTSGLLGGGSPAAPSSVPPTAPAAPQSAQPQSLPAPPAASAAGYTPMQNAPNSVATIVQSALPPEKAGPVIANMAKSLGVQPEAPLTAEQEQVLTRRLGAYASRTGVSPAAAAGQGPQLTPDALLRSVGAPQQANARVADAFSAVPVPPNAQASAAPPPPADVPRSAVAGGAAAPSNEGGGHPLVPQVPLPPGYTDPQKAILALRAEAARRSANPYAKGQVAALNDWATRIENSLAPIKMGQADTIVDPRTRQVLAQGPMAKALAGGTGGINAATLDADAERYRQTGQLPPNMGRGVQGQAEAAAIRQRAVEHEVNAGGNPDNWPQRWQEYRARGVGLSAGERVRATREENLNLILKVTDAAVPAALEQSAKVWRSGFVPLNKIIQHGQVMTSDAELRAFGMANLQLAEGWARAMNPTGVMRESDREKALEFLSTADSPETYRRLVTQLQTQITRERDSIRKGEPMRQGDSAPAPGIGGGSSGSTVVRWERGPNGELRQAK